MGEAFYSCNAEFPQLVIRKLSMVYGSLLNAVLSVICEQITAPFLISKSCPFYLSGKGSNYTEPIGLLLKEAKVSKE